MVRVRVFFSLLEDWAYAHSNAISERTRTLCARRGRSTRVAEPQSIGVVDQYRKRPVRVRCLPNSTMGVANRGHGAPGRFPMFAAWSLVSALALPTPSRGDTHHCECESLAAHATVLWPHGPLVPRPTRTTALTTNDVLSHYDYNASLTSFMHIVRNLMVGASFHSHVHIIRPLLADVRPQLIVRVSRDRFVLWRKHGARTLVSRSGPGY